MCSCARPGCCASGLTMFLADCTCGEHSVGSPSKTESGVLLVKVCVSSVVESKVPVENFEPKMTIPTRNADF